MKALLLEGIHRDAAAAFLDAGFDISQSRHSPPGEELEEKLADINVLCIRALYGDLNQNGSISVGDMQVVKNTLSQAIGTGNFLNDVNLSGAITVGDMQVVKNNLSHTVSLSSGSGLGVSLAAPSSGTANVPAPAPAS